MNDDNNFFLMLSLIQLLESKPSVKGEKNTERSKALSEKIGQLLESIPELENYLEEEDKNLRKKILVEIGRYIKYSKFEKGVTIKHLGEGDKFFYMTIYGKIIKLNIIYKPLYATLKEYILYLSKLLIIGEKYLYVDCIKKNQKVFNIKETINIMDYGKNIKSFDFEEEIQKIKNLRDEIFLLKYNEDEKIKMKLNVSELLTLYNPKMGEKNYSLNGQQKYCIILPFFYVDSTLNSIAFIGNLNKNYGIKKYSSYICLNNCDVFYIDKTEIKDEKLFSLTNTTKSDMITNSLFKKHYIFKDCQTKFLQKNYSKFVNVVKIQKGENLILQNSNYEGIFIIIKGVLQLKTKRSYNELNELKYNILNNFTNYVNLNNELESFRDKKRDAIMQRLLRNPQFIKEANEIKEVDFGTFVDTEIVGLCDLYDKYNGIYNFSVKCISNEAEFFFIPKEIFNSMLTNQDIEEKITKLTTEKIKILKLKIKRFIELFETEFDKLSPQFKEEKKNFKPNNLFITQNISSNTKAEPLKNISGKSSYELTPIKIRKKNLIRSESDSKITNSKTNNYIKNMSKYQENIILDKFIKYNKKYNNILNNSEKNINDFINENRISLRSNSKINNESNYDGMRSAKYLYSNKVNHSLINQNYNFNKNKKNYYNSISLFNHKQKPIDKNLFLNIINKTNLGLKRNFVNKKIMIKPYKNLISGGIAKNNKLYNFTPVKKINKISNDTLLMPLLSNKNTLNSFTFQDVINEL